MIHFSCVVAPIIFFVSPITVFYPAYLKGGRVELPPLVLTAQSLQCMVWFVFGMMLNQYVILIPNAIGTILGFIYLACYPYFWKPHLHRTQFMQQLAVSAVIFMSVMALYWIRKEDAIGIIGCTAGIIMLTSPVCVMFEVVKTSNVELMGSLWMGVAQVWCTFSCTVEGYCWQHKPQIWIQNGIGLSVSIIALVLRWGMHCANRSSYKGKMAGSPGKMAGSPASRIDEESTGFGESEGLLRTKLCTTFSDSRMG